MMTQFIDAYVHHQALVSKWQMVPYWIADGKHLSSHPSISIDQISWERDYDIMQHKETIS